MTSRTLLSLDALAVDPALRAGTLGLIVLLWTAAVAYSVRRHRAERTTTGVAAAAGPGHEEAESAAAAGR